LAFLRFSRDKRGVENFYLVQPTANRRGKVRSRVLYWFRSPPDVKVGREPFDPAVRRALEAQNPDITFDWKAIVETPIPSADADKWRERRRAERAAKQAAAREDSEEAEEAASAETGAEETPWSPEESVAVAAAAVPADVPQPGQGAPRAGDANRKRRRRRRGGGGRGANAPAPDAAPAASPPAPSEPSSGD
jgi:hypothetical protein